MEPGAGFSVHRGLTSGDSEHMTSMDKRQIAENCDRLKDFTIFEISYVEGVALYEQYKKLSSFSPSV
jgi:hypothetical protein